MNHYCNTISYYQNLWYYVRQRIKSSKSLW